EGFGQRDGDGGGVGGARDGGPAHVDRLGHAGGGREVGIVQQEAELIVVNEGGRNFAFDDAAVADHADRRVIFLHGGAPCPTRAAEKSADRNGPLGDRVSAAVGAEQRHLEQHAALKRFRVAE